MGRRRARVFDERDEGGAVRVVLEPRDHRGVGAFAVKVDHAVLPAVRRRLASPRHDAATRVAPGLDHTRDAPGERRLGAAAPQPGLVDHHAVPPARAGRFILLEVADPRHARD